MRSNFIIILLSIGFLPFFSQGFEVPKTSLAVVDYMVDGMGPANSLCTEPRGICINNPGAFKSENAGSEVD